MERDNEATIGRMERKKRQVRQNIIRTAVDLFEQQGFHQTTMEQIAQTADVARKTLYNYFPIKEAIADAYVREVSQGIAQESLEFLNKLPDTRSRMLTALKNTYRWVKSHPELADIVIRYRMRVTDASSEAETSETGTQSIIAAIIRQGQESGEIRADLSVRLITLHIDLLRGATALDWIQDTSKHDLDGKIEKLVDLVLYGASTRRP